MLCKQEKIYQCECGYITTNKQSYCGHRGNCKIAHPELLNKNRDYLKNRSWHNSSTVWNKGLTKETDYRVNKYAVKLKGRKIYMTEETKQKISNKLKQNPNGGGIRPHSGRGKSGKYKGFYCASTYELVYIIYNLDHNIIFDRCTLSYPYIYKNKIHKYYPDFIVEDGSLVEIKGYMTEIVNIKLSAVTDRHIKLLLKKDLQYAFDYVKNNYNYKQLADLYDSN